MVKRETANICSVHDLLNGSFVRTEGWNPSYFETSLGNLSRVNLMGFVVGKEGQDIFLDDGSGRIVLRSFEENKLSDIGVGAFVQAVGRPRTYNNQNYVAVEIIKEMDSQWGEFRKLQLSFLKRKAVPEKTTVKKVIENQVEDVENPFQRIIGFIKDLDAGEGADIEEVIKRSKIKNVERLIQKLIEEGEIFELKPGKLKILE